MLAVADALFWISGDFSIIVKYEEEEFSSFVDKFGPLVDVIGPPWYRLGPPTWWYKLCPPTNELLFCELLKSCINLAAWNCEPTLESLELLLPIELLEGLSHLM